jgi:AcrR family transcriptional regulator
LTQPSESASLLEEERSAGVGEAGDLGRRERGKAANRQAILAAARRVFAQLGYEATTVRDIIRGTDLAAGTFYNYFRSKEEISAALADESAGRFRPILRAAVARAENFEDFVRGAVSAYFHFVAEERAAVAGPHARDLHAGKLHVDTPEMRAVFEEVRSYIEGVIARGLAPAIDAEYFTAAAIGLAQEVCVRMLQREPPDVDGASAFCANLILGGAPALPRTKETP